MKRFLAFLLSIVMFMSFVEVGAAAADTEDWWETIPEKVSLIKINNSYYRVKGMSRIVCNYKTWVAKTEKMDKTVRYFNKVLDALDPHIPVYFYYVESSRSHPIKDEFPEDSDLYLHFKELLHCDASDHLKYTTFEEYCHYFYSTDHHWNYRGSYQGYLDVVRMLKGPDEPVLEPSETVVFPVIYNGSFSSRTQNYISKEKFTVYRFDQMPEYTAYAKGKKITYDRMKQYFNGKYGKAQQEPHYARFYGGDYGELLFKSKSEDGGKGNLLVFSDSMCNAIKALLIGHYDQILFIDLRYYEKEKGEHCSMQDVLSRFPADQILILTCNTAFSDTHRLYP